MTKLITERVDFVQPIVEAVDGGPKKYFLEGTYLQANILNKNGRVYPKHILQNEVARYIRECIVPKRALGELGHPDTPIVDHKQASHYITDLKEDGNNWIGRAKIMDTPNGRIVKAMMDEGITLGVSSRGMGTLIERNGVNHVQEDYRLMCVDIVHDPSGPDCIVNGIMENREFIFDSVSGNYKLIEDIQKEVRQATKVQLDEGAVLKAFEKLLRNI